MLELRLTYVSMNTRGNKTHLGKLRQSNQAAVLCLLWIYPYRDLYWDSIEEYTLFYNLLNELHTPGGGGGQESVVMGPIFYI